MSDDAARAANLYAQEKLTLAQAAKAAQMDRVEFQRYLADRRISLHLDACDLEQDLASLRALGRLS